MGSLASIDGRIVPAAEARVSIFDRGFLYGDSVFEALRTYGGVPFALDEHLERLGRSAERALIRMPVSLERFRAEVLALIAAAEHAETYLRLVVTRGPVETLGLDPALGQHPTRVVLAMELEPPRAETYERGIAVSTFRSQRVADATPAAGAKLSNYMVAVLAIHAARQVGAEEALVLDLAGDVVEGTTSNIFFVKNGLLVTPPEEAGILLGITRQKILELAAAAGIRVELRSFPPAELVAADEAFISSSIREIVPVVKVDEARVGSGIPGPLTHDLLRRLRALANASSVGPKNRELA